jgi:hypothetical protein
MTDRELLELALEVMHNQGDVGVDEWIAAEAAIKQALAAPVQEPVAMRMPKVGDKVVCIEDESLGTVVYLTAGGSPEIKFDDGSHGTYMLREFAELFGYTTPPAAKRPWVRLSEEDIDEIFNNHPTYQFDHFVFAEDVMSKYEEKNAAAQRPWVGLTEQERNAIEDYCEMIVGKPVFEAIEAKLKEKNT